MSRKQTETTTTFYPRSSAIMARFGLLLWPWETQKLTKNKKGVSRKWENKKKSPEGQLKQKWQDKSCRSSRLSGEKILCGKKAHKNQVGVSQVSLLTNVSETNFWWLYVFLLMVKIRDALISSSPVFRPWTVLPVLTKARFNLNKLHLRWNSAKWQHY